MDLASGPHWRPNCANFSIVGRPVKFEAVDDIFWKKRKVAIFLHLSSAPNDDAVFKIPGGESLAVGKSRRKRIHFRPFWPQDGHRLNHVTQKGVAGSI